jgi:hypothetical protein
LRAMLEHPTDVRSTVEVGRWIIETIHDSRPWRVIVEPDPTERLLVVVTAYPVDPK